MDNRPEGTTIIGLLWVFTFQTPYSLARRINALLADMDCGKRFQLSERKTCRLLMRSNQSLVVQSHRQQRNRLGCRTSERIQHPAFISASLF
jgi:hypothetical protein